MVFVELRMVFLGVVSTGKGFGVSGRAAFLISVGGSEIGATVSSFRVLFSGLTFAGGFLDVILGGRCGCLFTASTAALEASWLILDSFT